MQVIPAILTATPEEFKSQLLKLLPFFDYFQIDIQDGQLVESKTIDFDQVIEVLKNSPEFTQKEIVIDLDLMVQNFKEVVKKISNLPSNVKVNNLFLREKVVSKEEYEKLKESQLFSTFALEPADSIETIDQKYGLINLPSIQIMTIHSGPQGSPFVPEQLDKVEQLRNAGYRNKIFLDGAINEKTLPMILSKENLPDAICIGSYFSRSDNVEERIDRIYEILGENQTE